MPTHKPVLLTLVLPDWSRAARLVASLRHALIALCLYCVTGDEPSPNVLRRLLESNQKFIRIPLPQGLTIHYTPRPRSCSTGSAGPSSTAQPSPPAQILPDAGRNYAPAHADFNAWLETFAYASDVFASEAVVRTRSIDSRG